MCIEAALEVLEKEGENLLRLYGSHLSRARPTASLADRMTACCFAEQANPHLYGIGHIEDGLPQL